MSLQLSTNKETKKPLKIQTKQKPTLITNYKAFKQTKIQNKQEFNKPPQIIIHNKNKQNKSNKRKSQIPIDSPILRKKFFENQNIEFQRLKQLKEIEQYSEIKHNSVSYSDTDSDCFDDLPESKYTKQKISNSDDSLVYIDDFSDIYNKKYEIDTFIKQAQIEKKEEEIDEINDKKDQIQLKTPESKSLSTKSSVQNPFLDTSTIRQNVFFQNNNSSFNNLDLFSTAQPSMFFQNQPLNEKLDSNQSFFQQQMKNEIQQIQQQENKNEVQISQVKNDFTQISAGLNSNNIKGGLGKILREEKVRVF